MPMVSVPSRGDGHPESSGNTESLMFRAFLPHCFNSNAFYLVISYNSLGHTFKLFLLLNVFTSMPSCKSLVPARPDRYNTPHHSHSLFMHGLQKSKSYWIISLCSSLSPPSRIPHRIQGSDGPLSMCMVPHISP